MSSPTNNTDNFDDLSDREALMALLKFAKSTQSKLDSGLAQQATRMNTAEEDLADLQVRMLAAEIRDNIREQRDRNYAVRFFNFKSRYTDQRELCFELYTEFIKPAFKVAQQHIPHIVDTIPRFLDVWDAGHEVPVRGQDNGDPLPCIFKFATRGYLSIFLDYGVPEIEKFNKKRKTDVYIKKDLTAINKSCMSSLHDKVDSFWITGTNVKYTTYDEPEKTVVVTNPLGADFVQMHSHTAQTSKTIHRQRVQSRASQNGGGRGGGRGRGGRGGRSRGRGGRGARARGSSSRGGRGGRGGSGASGGSGETGHHAGPSGSDNQLYVPEPSGSRTPVAAGSGDGRGSDNLAEIVAGIRQTRSSQNVN